MRFTLAEYKLFKKWYEEDCVYGLNSFSYPVIDDFGSSTMKEYQFVAGTAPQFSNPSGSMIDCSMEWEEV